MKLTVMNMLDIIVGDETTTVTTESGTTKVTTTETHI